MHNENLGGHSPFRVKCLRDTYATYSRAMCLASRGASLQDMVGGYINAHGTSTPYNDKFETIAIKKVLGEEIAKQVRE